jgi:hypothetical protein
LDRPRVTEIDNALHAERLNPDRSKRSYPTSLDKLPDGVFVTMERQGDQAYLVWRNWLLAWSPGGYRERRPRSKGERVRLLTPPSIVAAIRAGYVPEVHASAGPRQRVVEEKLSRDR